MDAVGKKMRLKRTKQCAKCPWKKSTNPHDIPNGYCEIKHANLEGTIAEPGDLSQLASGELRIMACHEEHEAHCIGWLVNQMGRGNNIALRIAMLKCENGDEVETFGDQHETFEETLP
jgi:hypothetical protein